MLLHSRHPMFLWWSEGLIQFYNDAYLPSFGKGKHPAAMGQRGADCWQEIWPVIWPQINDVMRHGKSSWHENHLVPIFRNNHLEEVYWTYGYSPVFDDRGTVAGTLVVCTETTARVIGDRRLRLLQELAERMNSGSDETPWFKKVAAVLAQYPHDIPYALIYQMTARGDMELAASFGLDDEGLARLGSELHPCLTNLANGDQTSDLDQRLLTLSTVLPGNPWPEASRQAYIAPLVDSQAGARLGLAVLGTSPRLPLNAPNLQHLGHVAERISQAAARQHAELERERLLREVRAEQQRLHNLFAQAPAFMCVLEGPEHVFSLANDCYYELVGRRDIVGKTVLDALPETKGQGFVELLDQVYRSGESYFGTGVAVKLARHADQPAEERFVDFVYQAFRDSDGAVVGIVVHGVDQTTRYHAEQAMKDADRRKDEFLAILAHELRNPLAPIANYAQLLEHCADDGEAVKRASVAMQKQVDQMVRLIDDLLDVSRISSGKIELRRDRIELASVVRQALDATRPYYEQRRTESVVTLAQDAIYVDADSARLSQVIGNLLHNAAKFTNEGGHVWLSVEREADMAVLRVRDDGIGIDPGQLTGIFQLFTQADTSLERLSGGLGIGLALVRKLVELHGGEVEATSGGIGRGSEFVVRLPVADTESAQHDTRHRAAANPSSGKRILIVDDNRDACDSMAQLLQVCGHDTKTAYDGLAGVAAAETYSPDVILLDLGMPNLNGYDACWRIRAQPSNGTTLLIALTGWGQAEDKRRTKEAGFDAHLVKPVDVAKLEGLLALAEQRAD